MKDSKYERSRRVIRFGSHKATIYRRNDIEASSWFLRLPLPAEGKQYRVSLKTLDEDDAVVKATDKVIEILAKVKSGQRITSQKFKELVRVWGLELDKMLANGDNTSGTHRLKVMKLRQCVAFITHKYPSGLETSLGAIDGTVFADYLDWRVGKGKIRRDVVQMELQEIHRMFQFGVKNKLCPEAAIPVWEFTVEKIGSKRERMTSKDYTKVTALMREFIAESNDERDKYHRYMAHHIFLLMGNSGMRTGEVLGLKNKDIELHRKNLECVVTVKATISKVHKERSIYVSASHQGRKDSMSRINYLIRWVDEHQRHRAPDDYVFSTYDEGSAGDKRLYETFGEFRKEKLIPAGLEWFDLYHCRHFWITVRLLAGEPIQLIAATAGTSVRMIEETYSHVITKMVSRKFGEKRVTFDDDGGHEITVEG